MNTVPRTYRLDDVVEEIRRAEFITAPELAYRFDVSVRTIQRDIRRIKQDYAQVYFKRGNGGGIGWNNGEYARQTERREDCDEHPKSYFSECGRPSRALAFERAIDELEQTERSE